ncbi:MAG: citramalate synthase [Candidatus Binatia bacterium]|nr:citramalate synthase [Candidatus Binatia bacterium]
MKPVQIYDTTLRDGCQGEEVDLSVESKLAVAERLDAFGVQYIEGGWPGSNPRDAAFFAPALALGLKTATVVAFGSTRRAGTQADKDDNLAMLLQAGTSAACVVGKTWDLHVREALRVSEQENLDIIHDTMRHLRANLDEVIFDAEHFFDGWAARPEFTLKCLKAAADGGATLLCLCDTRGGSLPGDITAGVEAARALVETPLGIHCHNDGEMAVANSIAGVQAGCVQVQGTVNGVGERCGNANLVSIVPNLQLKLGYDCVTEEALQSLTELAHFVDELANREPNKQQAYVGRSAFAHKAGLHASAVRRHAETYEHIAPEIVGNHQRVLVSDQAGRSNLLYKAKELGIDPAELEPKVAALLKELKELEHQGFQFEGADASFELLLQKAIKGTKLRHFELVGFRVINEKRSEDEDPIAEATIQVRGPDGRLEHTASMGNGPVNAIDSALRKALSKFYPAIEEMRLVDYKVRVLDDKQGTEGMVRVLVESHDSHGHWTTVGVSPNVIDASYQALVDAIDFKLYKDDKRAAAASATNSA